MHLQKEKKKGRFLHICSLFYPPVKALSSKCLCKYTHAQADVHTHALTTHTHSHLSAGGPASITSDGRHERLAWKTTASLIQIYDPGCWNWALCLFGVFSTSWLRWNQHNAGPLHPRMVGRLLRKWPECPRSISVDLHSGRLGIEIELFVSFTSAISIFVCARSTNDRWVVRSHFWRGFWRGSLQVSCVGTPEVANVFTFWTECFGTCKRKKKRIQEMYRWNSVKYIHYQSQVWTHVPI